MSFVSGDYYSLPAVCDTPPAWSCYDFCFKNVTIEFNGDSAILIPHIVSGTPCDRKEFCQIQAFSLDKNSNGYTRRYLNSTTHGVSQKIELQNNLLISVNEYDASETFPAGECYSALKPVVLAATPLENAKSDSKIGLHIGIAIPIVLLLVAAFVIFYFWYKKRKNAENEVVKNDEETVKVEPLAPFLMHPRYVAIADYQPILDDELEVFAGDHIIVHSLHSDGWATGINERTGCRGQVAMNILKQSDE
ncbi:hypothetical protein HDU92_003570 [Lobulomyces angularis]|nr:hypothetical protein HDU92_003570 [Lobulomyces angularis]